MFVDLLSVTGSWTWVIFGLVILAVEILVPSTFLLWPGLAALLVGGITLAVGVDNPLWPWQVQVLVFLAGSLLAAWLGRKYLRSRNLEASDQPNLNERGTQLIGQTATVSTAIKNGRGRARLGDTTWTVHGPDTAAGGTVRVIGSEGMTSSFFAFFRSSR